MRRYIRLMVVILTVMLWGSALTGCKSSDASDYEKAQQLSENGNFEEARDIYLSLGDYQDSAYQANLATLKQFLSGDGVDLDTSDNKATEKSAMRVTACNTENNDAMLVTITHDSTGKTYLGSYEINSTISATIPYNSGAETGAYIEGNSTSTGKGVYLEDYDVSDSGKGRWDIASYTDGATVLWDEYEHSGTGTTINGDITIIDGDGHLGGDSLPTYFSLLAGWVNEVLQNSNSGVTMSDLGFLAWQS